MDNFELVSPERRRDLLACKLRSHDLAVVAEKWGVSVESLECDWTRRHLWLPELVGSTDVESLIAERIAELKEVIRKCWELIDNAERNQHETSASQMLKSLIAAEIVLNEFLQSLGRLPKVAAEQHIEVKQEQVEVLADESEASVINEAARILNKKKRRQEEPSSIH